MSLRIVPRALARVLAPLPIDTTTGLGDDLFPPPVAAGGEEKEELATPSAHTGGEDDTATIHDVKVMEGPDARDMQDEVVRRERCILGVMS